MSQSLVGDDIFVTFLLSYIFRFCFGRTVILAMVGKRLGRREALSISRSALFQRDGKSAVFVLDGSHVQLREIRLGRDFGDRVEVVEGLGPNDRVVVRGLEGLTSGRRVTPMPPKRFWTSSAV